MPWLQLTLQVPAAQADLASEALTEGGAIAVTLQDDIGEIVIETQWDRAPLWSRVRISALLPEETDTARLQEYLKLYLGRDQPVEYHVGHVEDQDWMHAWKKHYKPIHMGGRLWICPSWCEPPQPEAVNIVLDPGMAFGTGEHPTTALCLEWLAQQDLRDKVVLDYGCGSGILAIAALRLGARAAYATDLDPQALIVTRENAERNGVIDKLQISLPDELPPRLVVDVVVANILAGALTELAPTLIAHVKPGGGIALSGLLDEQGAAVHASYAPPFDLQTNERQGWIALVGSRP